MQRTPLMSMFTKWFNRRYRPHYRRARGIFIFDLILLALTIATIAGTFIFFVFFRTSSIVIITSDIIDDPVQSGVPITRNVTVSNPSSDSLFDVNLTFRAPTGLAVADTTQHHIDELEPHSSVDIPITATAWGIPGDRLSLSVASEARTHDDHIDRAFGTVAYDIAQGALSTSVTLPEHLFVTQPIIASFAITSELEQEIENLTMQVATTTGVTITSEPLVVNTPHSSILRGVVDQEEFSFDVVLYTQIGDDRVRIHRAHVQGIAKPLDVSLSLSLDDPLPSLSDGTFFSPIVTLRNEMDVPLQNVVVQLIPTSSCVSILHADNFEGVVPAGGGFERAIRAQVSFSCAPTKGEFFISSRVIFSLDDLPDAIIHSGSTLRFDAAATPHARARVRYYSGGGDQLGRGPLPPQVGETTSMWVFVDIQSDFGSILGPTFSAELPAYVTWTGRSSVSYGDAVSYDPTSGHITWQGDVLHHNDQVSIGFELGFSPPSTDTYPLLEHASFTGQDLGSRSIISVPLTVSSDLSDDPFVP